MPTQFRVQLRADFDQGDPPPLYLGCWDRAIPEAEQLQTQIPFETTRKQIYAIARKFCIWVNIVKKPGYEAYLNQQRLYSEEVAIRERHNHLVVRTTQAIERDFNYEQLKAATNRARDLLKQLNYELWRKMECGDAFYLKGLEYVYIVSPRSKKLSVLLPEGPKSLCVYITDPNVQENKYDWAIAMWTYLQGAEQHVLQTANHFDFWLADGGELNGTVQAENAHAQTQQEINAGADRELPPTTLLEGA